MTGRNCVDCDKKIRTTRVRCFACYLRFRKENARFPLVRYCEDCNKKLNKSNVYSVRCHSCAQKHKGLVGEKNPVWRGDNVKYRPLHDWVKYWLGRPNECAYCGEDQKIIQWASISHQAKRDLNDYIPLCAKCHGRYDRGFRSGKGGVLLLVV